MFASSACRVARAASRSTAVRGAARRTLASPAVATAAPLDPPSVFDSVVKLTIIDPSGARRVIPAYVGSSLYDACDANGVDLGPASYGDPEEKVRSSTWTEPLYGSGAGSGFDHVLLQGGHEGVKALDPPQSNELKLLHVYWDEDEVFPESRLASQVEINSKMDGMVVYVPDRLVDDIP